MASSGGGSIIVVMGAVLAVSVEQPARSRWPHPHRAAWLILGRRLIGHRWPPSRVHQAHTDGLSSSASGGGGGSHCWAVDHRLSSYSLFELFDEDRIGSGGGSSWPWRWRRLIGIGYRWRWPPSGAPGSHRWPHRHRAVGVAHWAVDHRLYFYTLCLSCSTLHHTHTPLFFSSHHLCRHFASPLSLPTSKLQPHKS